MQSASGVWPRHAGSAAESLGVAVDCGGGARVGLGLVVLLIASAMNEADGQEVRGPHERSARLAHCSESASRAHLAIRQ
jgi:hypothetical protein